MDTADRQGSARFFCFHTRVQGRKTILDIDVDIKPVFIIGLFVRSVDLKAPVNDLCFPLDHNDQLGLQLKDYFSQKRRSRQLSGSQRGGISLTVISFFQKYNKSSHHVGNIFDILLNSQKGQRTELVFFSHCRYLSILFDALIPGHLEEDGKWILGNLYGNGKSLSVLCSFSISFRISATQLKSRGKVQKRLMFYSEACAIIAVVSVLFVFNRSADDKPDLNIIHNLCCARCVLKVTGFSSRTRSFEQIINPFMFQFKWKTNEEKRKQKGLARRRRACELVNSILLTAAVMIFLFSIITINSVRVMKIKRPSTSTPTVMQPFKVFPKR